MFDKKEVVDKFCIKTEPERFKKEVYDKFETLVPSIKQYTHVMYRKIGILDSKNFCESLINTLKTRPNVSFHYNSEVLGYNFGSNRCVSSVITPNACFPCDILVLCLGP